MLRENAARIGPIVSAAISSNGAGVTRSNKVIIVTTITAMPTSHGSTNRCTFLVAHCMSTPPVQRVSAA
ncbi:hypothetical protein Are01nite_23670 [Actinoplanes regularis]|nr:hypothetical protein Are01nite_23670 [Actinoplanes regularis]